MNTYHVTPWQGTWECVPAMAVDNIMWTPDAGIRMRAQIAYDSEAIYVRQQAVEQDIRATQTKVNSQVCEDSCMEFFLSPCPQDGRYLNFELNPLGTLHLGFGHGRHDAIKLAPKFADQRFQIAAERTEEGWELRYRIPAEFLRCLYPDLTLEPGRTMTANCYKCGDCTPNPHFLAWNAPTSETPDFHRPQDFGRLVFV